MYLEGEMDFFLENGYLHARGVLNQDELNYYRAEFDRVWEAEKPKVNQHRLLKYQSFIDLIEHPNILKRQQAIFGAQTQLLQYDLLRQGPHSEVPARSWHRDFIFPGDRPLSINTILYLDEMTEERGPTRMVPGTHRGETYPPDESRYDPLPGEVAAYSAAGDAVFINGAIWHTGGCNKTEGLRRGIFLYFGYWWMKRYESETKLPWQASQNASEQRLRLLGIKMPDRDIHQYDPTMK
ncbi:phytanoyl-CoA dioxygenase family protein [Chloroflexi bacterium TSY]|nr:phytanoyl-CoA dioxygenase family protein [Chloroflexi bacterium TSY]